MEEQQRVTLAVTAEQVQGLVDEAYALSQEGRYPRLCSMALTIWLHTQPEERREQLYQQIAAEVAR